ncbi:MAG: hypothetical protein ABJH28_13000 [Paraglaciecola sp.]|uniref:hypothetical protein n=1 Tax=Paraglaciecola sp. TaxID=1920173 RepID=UPI003265CE6F
MKKFILFIAFFWLSLNVQAHGFDYSVVTFTEQDNNTWSLQIKSSLDAFRKEVKMHFSDTPYTTPEEFNQQVLAHLNKTLQVTVKGNVISLGKGTVYLGHETSVLFTEVKIPANTAAVKVVNGAVKDIYRHTTKLFVAPHGVPKSSYILNQSNHFTAEFKVQ